MTESWHTRFTDWYRSWRRRQIPEDIESSVHIELSATDKDPRRVDSSISFGKPKLLSNSHAMPELNPQHRKADSIYLEIDFGDVTCFKSLDYGTFSRWSAIEGLMIDMEADGIIFEELWDMAESMRVCRGDWDARARPGWVILVQCQNVQTMLEKHCFEDDSDSDSEDPEGERDYWIDDVLDHYQEEWCLPRWRHRVELERSISMTIQEPSWLMLGLGCATVVFFIVAAVVYTA